jgi:phage gp29-like protein
MKRCPDRAIAIQDALQDPQATRNAREEYLHPGWGADITQVFASFVRAEHGRPRMMCDLIDDRTRSDAKWRGMQEARTSAVTGREAFVVPGGTDVDDRRAADALNAAIERYGIDLYDYLEHTVRSSLRYGWALVEQEWVWNQEERRYDVSALHSVRCRNTQVATTNGVYVANSAPGEVLVQVGRHEHDVARQIPDKYIEVRGSSTDPVVHAGIGATSAAWSTMKMQAAAGNLLLLDRFGLPFVEAEVADWSNETDKETARQMLRNFGRDAGILTARNARIVVKIHEGIALSRASTSDPHGRFMTICDHENAILWNGSAYASQMGQSGSSYALANEQGNVEFRLTLGDVRRISKATENQWFRRWMRFNSLRGKTPKLRIFVERVEDPTQLTTIMERLAKIGYRVDPRQIEERTGLRRVADTDDEKSTEDAS